MKKWLVPFISICLCSTLSAWAGPKAKPALKSTAAVSIPAYPGAQKHEALTSYTKEQAKGHEESVAKANEQLKKSSVYCYSTKDEYTKVFAFYSKALTKQGFMDAQPRATTTGQNATYLRMKDGMGVVVQYMNNGSLFQTNLKPGEKVPEGAHGIYITVSKIM